MTIPEFHMGVKGLDQKREEFNDLLVYNLGRKNNVYVCFAINHLLHFSFQNLGRKKVIWVWIDGMNIQLCQLNTPIHSSTFDLCGKMPSHMDANKRAKVWDEELHFIKAGHREMGIMMSLIQTERLFGITVLLQ
ncbi:06f8aab5-0990-4f8e-b8b9-c4ac3a48efd3-CDS [Sclerotinia trifoliorum]|uniref:06f8aab5-0990-4f8e-b8b9-c4ac3a48efd3-CDS n=1 Tax=Sclerotinia trifoliorum TaxID=28548 RepID=A0A8H2ZQS5_9HELO|nr:06f8aab5-0990-4f8e-b8b9-c4ac3a48efd3-CDS [Sclerotinia trifoliorum]